MWKGLNTGHKWMLGLAGTFGALLVMVTYWFFHDVYARNFSELPNAKLAVLLLSISLAAFIFLSTKSREINGWKIVLYGIGLQFFTLLIYSRATEGVTLSVREIIPFLAYSSLLHVFFIFIMFTSYGLGEKVLKWVFPEEDGSGFDWLALGVGISIVGLTLIPLGILGMMKWWLVWPLFLALFFWRIRVIKSALQRFFLQKYYTTPSQWVNNSAVLLCLVFLAISFIRSVKLFPLGFDGVSVYMNISHLIASSGSLPTGFSAYNWSLFMALGETMTGWESMSIAISHFIILPLLFYLTYLSRVIFKMKHYWLPALIFLFIPATGYHVLLDEKIDLGFLLIVMAAVHLAWKIWGSDLSWPADKVNSAVWKPFALLGILIGYAIGIKYLGFFTLIGIAGMWMYRLGGWKPVLGLTLLSVGLFFFTGAYKIAYVDLGDGSPALVGAIPFFLGLVLLFISMASNWSSYLRQWFPAAILSLSTLIVFSPWIVKNLTENKVFSLETVLFGSKEMQIIESKDVVKRLDRIIEVSNLFRKNGIEMDQSQMVLLAEHVRVAPDYSLSGLREFLEKSLLRPEQLALFNEQRGSFQATGVSESAQYLTERMERLLAKRGIELDAAQKIKLQQLVAEMSADRSNDNKDNTKDIRSMREAILQKVLSESQKEEVFPSTVQYLNTVSSNSLSGAQIEEIKRYMGYDKGLTAFITLPFDLTMNTNIPDTRYLDLGFLFLIWLGMLFISSSGKSAVWGILFLLSIWMFSFTHQFNGWAISHDGAGLADYLGSLTSTHPGRLSLVFKWLFIGLNYPLLWMGTQLNGILDWMSELSFIWTMSALILISAGAFTLAKNRLQSYDDSHKMLLAFAGVYAILWFLFGNGIVWYAFPAIAFFLPIMVSQTETDANTYNRKWIPWVPYIGFMALGLTLPFSIYSSQEGANRALIFTDSFIEAAGKFEEKEATFPYFLPYMKETLDLINSDPNARVYRVGTFFNYHISQNNERVIEDNQLELFSNAVKEFKDQSVFVPLLYENGVRYVLFDLNIGTMDRTPDKSLVAKANELIRILSNSHKAEMVYTDNIILDPTGGTVNVGREVIAGKPGFSENTIRQGTYVLFKINP
jgi:hypothetical protein